MCKSKFLDLVVVMNKDRNTDDHLRVEENEAHTIGDSLVFKQNTSGKGSLQKKNELLAVQKQQQTERMPSGLSGAGQDSVRTGFYACVAPTSHCLPCNLSLCVSNAQEETRSNYPMNFSLMVTSSVSLPLD